jgi:hypothetical protein
MPHSTVLVTWTCVVFVLVGTGCSDPKDYANPYDAENLVTAGSPPNVNVRPGDGEAILTWNALGVKGIREYRIYRRFEGDSGSSFALVHTEPARLDAASGREKPGELYVFRDNDEGRRLLNDQVDLRGKPVSYVYRLTVVDVNGVETPNPAQPPGEDETPLRVWPSKSVSPSVAPPSPNVDVSVADLVVRLAWEDYEPPGDAVAYRIYSRIATDELNPELDLIKEIPISSTIIGISPGEGEAKDYVDTQFLRDLTTKEYRVGVIDKFGVESADTPETRRRVTVPNLPPGPLKWSISDVSVVQAGIRVTFRWNRPIEKDVSGYNIYSRFDGPWRLRKTVGNENELTAFVIETSPFLPEYFVTAFDNTSRGDGNFDQVYPPE